jgi:voltage-gated potassium channel
MLLQHYTFLEAAYMTIITLASVGYGETKTLDNTGRVFTICLILANLAILTFVITKISKFLFDGDFRNLYKKLKMENSIEKLENHIIVCGYGQNGTQAIKELKKSNLDLVVIDKVLATNDDVKYFIHDDATKDEVLLKAGIRKAKALLITLPNDAENIFVVLTAKELNPNIKIISRASKDTSVKKLKTAGASSIIMPDKVGGIQMANLLLIPDVKEFMDVMNTYQSNGNNIVEIVPNHSKTLAELNCWQQTGVLLLGIKKETGEYIVNPKADYKIELSDKIIILGDKYEINALKKLI